MLLFLLSFGRGLVCKSAIPLGTRASLRGVEGPWVQSVIIIKEFVKHSISKLTFHCVFYEKRTLVDLKFEMCTCRFIFVWLKMRDGEKCLCWKSTRILIFFDVSFTRVRSRCTFKYARQNFEQAVVELSWDVAAFSPIISMSEKKSAGKYLG